MSKYLILIYQDEAAPQSEGETVNPAYREFIERRASSILGGAALESPAVGTTVRRDHDGNVVVTDGLFAESKEVIGGYFLIEAADLDEALTIAAEVPAGAGVEVRPVRMVS
ncbi:YciI family protein [Agromyces sp. NPDC055520]